MRIRLRPYHPTWVIGFFGLGGMKKGFNKRGFDYVMDAIRRNPEIEVEFVEEHDDICVRCDRRVPDEKGCVWASDYTCTTAQNPEAVEGVGSANQRILQLLELDVGSVVRFQDLVSLLAERLPDLGKTDVAAAGDGSFQEHYQKGLDVLRAMWMQK